MRRRNRAILADITDLGLDPKKPYTKVSKTGNLVDDVRKEIIVEKNLPKQKIAIEKPVVVEPIETEKDTEAVAETTSAEETSVKEAEVSATVEEAIVEATVKAETVVKLPLNKKKKK